MNIPKTLGLLFCLLFSFNIYALPIEPANGTNATERQLKKKKPSTFNKSTYVLSTAVSESGLRFLLVFSFISGLVGMVLFTSGANNSVTLLWALGIGIWGFFGLILYISILWMYFLIKKSNSSQPIGIGTSVAGVFSLAAFSLNFVGGLVSVIWGLIVGSAALWVPAAIFAGVGLLMTIINATLFKNI